MSKIRLCTDCGDTLEKVDVKRNVCNTCNSIRSAIWQKQNKEKVAAKARRASLKRYGITEEIYQSMLLSQKGTCKICKGKNKSNKRLTVDHSHKTGKVRGIICIKCNSVLGLANDDIDILKSAIKYLKEHS